MITKIVLTLAAVGYLVLSMLQGENQFLGAVFTILLAAFPWIVSRFFPRL